MIKRAAIWTGLLAAAVLSLFVFWGEKAADRAGGDFASGKSDGRAYLWLNGRLYQARARALFDRGLSRLGEPSARDADFRRAYDYFRRSLALNPFSAVAHFDFGQALQYFNALDFAVPERYFDEYRKAADLSGGDTAVYFEVGKVLLSRWSGLSSEERRFTERILHTLLALGGPERSRRCGTILNLWEVNVGDVQSLREILPEAASTFRQAADFLGGKGLFLESRLDFLARAEALELKAAGAALQAGLGERNARRPAEALRLFRDADKLLDGIYFYQNLAPGKEALKADEYLETRKSVRLGILKCLLDEAVEPKDLLADFRSYLEAEDSLGALGELESLFEARGLIAARSPTGFVDLPRLSLALELNYKQNRYRDVVQVGQALSRNPLVAPDEERRSYGGIFELVGDACQRLDDLYESNAYYEKSLSLGPRNPVVLIKMRRNYERLNDGPALRNLQPLIDSLLTPEQTSLVDEVWPAGIVQRRTLILDEKTYRLAIVFSDFSTDSPALISVVFNGRVVTETLLASDRFETEIQAAAGPNELRIASVNRTGRPIRMTVSPVASPPEGKRAGSRLLGPEP